MYNERAIYSPYLPDLTIWGIDMWHWNLTVAYGQIEEQKALAAREPRQ